jgi:hypothetical protein
LFTLHHDRLNCRWTASVAATAAFYGETEALEWLKLEGCTFDETVFEAAARGGNHVTVNYITAIHVTVISCNCCMA